MGAVWIVVEPGGTVGAPEYARGTKVRPADSLSAMNAVNCAHVMLLP
jgi:hypothetical protein